MLKPTLEIVCPSCKKKAIIVLTKDEFSTFRVKCPHCGTTIQLHSIKGFKQVSFRKPDQEQIAKEFRDAEDPSRN